MICRARQQTDVLEAKIGIEPTQTVLQAASAF
jgi:hypothetical protein